MDKDLKAGTLYIVGTPIGNLEDITFRAIRILKEVDLIAAEDTRHTGKLLQHFEITTPQVSYHEHNRVARGEELLSRLKKGLAIALVTDAGMPLISDPGYDLVKACIKEELSVVPIPGVTAAITALSGAGLGCDRFVFEGFLPTKSKERRDRLNCLKEETRTMIFYESPHRLRETLKDLAGVFSNNRPIALGRELTKLHEEFWRGTIIGAINLYSDNRKPKGEYTLVVAGSEGTGKNVLSEDEIKAELEKLFSEGISRSQASRKLAQLTGIPRRQIYQLALSI